LLAVVFAFLFKIARILGELIVRFLVCPNHDQVKEDDVGRACRTNGGEEEFI
jgi:hypothetical protein